MKPTAQRRRDRRALLDNLLARMLRGRLTAAEAALLAESIREEQRAYDQTRRSLGETTTALTRHREAADAAIREAEQRTEEAEQRLARIRDMADAWKRRLPAAIRTATAADAVRLAAGGDYRPVMFEATADQAAAAADAEQHRAAEQRLAAQQERHEERRRALAEALDVDPAALWPQLVEHARATAHSAGRYRTAWFAARRDRRADRAAMAAELPLAAAGRAALAVADELFVAGRTEVEREAGRRILAAAQAAAEQRPAEQRPAEPQHTGGNAEQCPACPNTNPPYPFLCPATPTAAQEA
ncbi:hypothetical protein ACIQUU_32005 [Streptomyces sp. NPDC101116]|uniref:hypothetical protein n=1 Tax=Streptomyces sp. NPDC101116 TaxID=3366107 RepID=UPI0037F1104A